MKSIGIFRDGGPRWNLVAVTLLGGAGAFFCSAGRPFVAGELSSRAKTALATLADLMPRRARVGADAGGAQPDVCASCQASAEPAAGGKVREDEAIVLIPKVVARAPVGSPAVESILAVRERMGPDASHRAQDVETLGVFAVGNPRVRLERPWVGAGPAGLSVRVSIHNDGTSKAEGYVFGVATLMGPSGEVQELASHADIELGQLTDPSNGGRGERFAARRVSIKELDFESHELAAGQRFVQLKVIVSKSDKAGPGLIATYELTPAPRDGAVDATATTPAKGPLRAASRQLRTHLPK